MKFVKLTRASDRTPVWISVNHISAVYQYYQKNTTVVDYGGDDGQFAEVIESVDLVMAIIREALGE